MYPFLVYPVLRSLEIPFVRLVLNTSQTVGAPTGDVIVVVSKQPGAEFHHGYLHLPEKPCDVGPHLLRRQSVSPGVLPGAPDTSSDYSVRVRLVECITELFWHSQARMRASQNTSSDRLVAHHSNVEPDKSPEPVIEITWSTSRDASVSRYP
jgi:hypothetical protein